MSALYSDQINMQISIRQRSVPRFAHTPYLVRHSFPALNTITPKQNVQLQK